MVHLLSRAHPVADRRIPYGGDASQFGDLWLPQGVNEKTFPVVVFFHGGWWKSAYDLEYAGHLCAALREEGIACWSVEYRRVGETGGGWPYTLQDAAAGFDFVTTLAERYPLDLSRTITMGHSAGGHLAFWVAGKRRLVGTIALAGAVDLRLTVDLAGDGAFAHDRDEVHNLMGGSPREAPERYAAGNPGDLLPFGVRQVLIQGIEDDQIPAELPARWVEQSRAMGDDVSVEMLDSCDHFDVVDPESAAWNVVRGWVHRLLLMEALAGSGIG